MNIPIIIFPECGCGCKLFRIRIKDESGICECIRCRKSYFLADSIDLWYLIIQNKIPTEKKCKCGNYQFSIFLEFNLYQDKKGIRSFTVKGECNSCKTKKRFYHSDIKINSLELLSNPLTLCENPNLKYDLHEYTGHFSRREMSSLVTNVKDSTGINIFSLRHFKNQEQENFKIEEPISFCDLIQRADYLKLILSFEQLNTQFDYTWMKNSFEKFWMQNEVVVISSPRGISYFDKTAGLAEKDSNLKIGEEYCLYYSKTFIKNNLIVNKTTKFNAVINKIEEYFTNSTVRFRGRQFWDSPEEYKRLFGEKGNHKNLSFRNSFSIKADLK